MWTWSNHQKNTNKSPSSSHGTGGAPQRSLGHTKFRTPFQGDHVDICQKLFALGLRAQEKGKPAGGCLFWKKICWSHQPLGVVGDGTGGGDGGEKPSSIPSVFAGAHQVLGLSKLLGVVTETCPTSRNSKSKRMDKIVSSGGVSNYRQY